MRNENFGKFHVQSASAQHSPAPGSNVEGDILLRPHDGGVVGEGVHQTREDDVLAPPGHAVGLGVDGGPPDEHQLGRQRGDQLVPVREHVAEVGLLRGLAGHQGEVLGDCLQYSMYMCTVHELCTEYRGGRLSPPESRSCPGSTGRQARGWTRPRSGR